MPELPEVETVRRGLEPVMSGCLIEQAEIRRPDLRWPFPAQMQARLTGRRVKQLRRRSKYILADLDSRETLLIHLGMSGRMLISGEAQGVFYRNHIMPEKHDHVVLSMSSGARITFNDARRFGAMDLWPTMDLEAHWLLRALGPEPLGNGFNETYLQRALAHKKTSIKAALLDQRIVAGLGNIYVCEALFRAGISPKRQAGQISARRISALVSFVRSVLAEAIDAGGSSLRDHRQTDGELGYFQHSFQVYGREEGACLRGDCNGEIARIPQSGRSTFYCPRCQR
ncbi:MAG: bifunctional DNA-formamidopyrimidine glycosylase/DNA-(apurinic or apyrimidinic site) lyase [Pseudomonadota bacterium]